MHASNSWQRDYHSSSSDGCIITLFYNACNALMRVLVVADLKNCQCKDVLTRIGCWRWVSNYTMLMKVTFCHSCLATHNWLSQNFLLFFFFQSWRLWLSQFCWQFHLLQSGLHCYFECTIQNIDVSVDYSHGLKCVLRSVVEFLAFAPGTIWLDLSPAHWTGSNWGHFLTSTSFPATFTTQWYSCCIVRLQQSVGLHICWLLSYSWRDPGKKVTASTCSWRQFNSDAQTMFVFGKGNAIGGLSKGRGWWGWKRLLLLMLSYIQGEIQAREVTAICSQFTLTPKNLQFWTHFVVPKNLQFWIHFDAQKPAILNCPRLPWSWFHVQAFWH